MSEDSKRRGPSAGAVVIALTIFFFALSGVVLYFIVTSSGSFGTRISLPTTKGTAGEDPLEGVAVERPAQTAPAGGQRAEWAAQGLSWTVPARWRPEAETDAQFVWSGPGAGGDPAASLAVTATPMPDALGGGAGLAAIYEEALREEARGAYAGVRLVELAGIRGVEFREPARGEGRLHWQAYRSTAGGTQLINVVVAAPGGDDALYAMLHSLAASGPPAPGV